MRYNEAHKQKSRERILEAARSVFAEVGFERATIDKVMSEANMTRGGFYKHFPNKTALLLEIMSDGQVSASDDVPSQVADLLHRYLESDLEDEENGCPLFAFPNDTAQQGDDLKSAYEGVAKSIAEVLTLALPDQNKETGLALMAMSVGFTTVMNSSLDPEFKETLRKAAIGQILKAIESDATT